MPVFSDPMQLGGNKKGLHHGSPMTHHHMDAASCKQLRGAETCMCTLQSQGSDPAESMNKASLTMQLAPCGLAQAWTAVMQPRQHKNRLASCSSGHASAPTKQMIQDDALQSLKRVLQRGMLWACMQHADLSCHNSAYVLFQRQGSRTRVVCSNEGVKHSDDRQAQGR